MMDNQNKQVFNVSQEILIEHEKLQGLPRQRVKIGSSWSTHEHKECTTWDQVVFWYAKLCQL
jgi:hypothetical protein